MLVIDAEIMKTSAFVAVARSEDDDLDPNTAAYGAVASLPGLRLQSPFDPRSHERQGFLNAARILALTLKEVVVVLDHSLCSSLQRPNPFVEIA